VKRLALSITAMAITAVRVAAHVGGGELDGGGRGHGDTGSFRSHLFAMPGPLRLPHHRAGVLARPGTAQLAVAPSPSEHAGR
jgi:hypothetical protein